MTAFNSRRKQKFLRFLATSISISIASASMALLQACGAEPGGLALDVTWPWPVGVAPAAIPPDVHSIQVYLDGPESRSGSANIDRGGVDFTGLRIGSYTIRVTAMAETLEPRYAGTSRATVEAGKVTQVDLSLQSIGIAAEEERR